MKTNGQGVPSPLSTIATAGLLAGTLDITAACTQSYIMRGTSPVVIFQSVASGVLGVATYQGGWKTAALGLLLHFFIATSAAAVFYFASRVLRFLTEHWALAGVLYGVLVYTVMYWIVVPLSKARPFNPTVQLVTIAVLIHIFCIGLPIAWVTRKC
jgi:hypothetical protein